MRLRPLQIFCDFLSVSGTPRHSDLIFVLAGRLERKLYGLQLFQSELAPRLILSVGRFEVRKMASLGLKDDGGLVGLARQTPVGQRHFFLDLTGDSPRAVVAGPRGKGTYAELSSLASYLDSEPVHSVTLVSTSIHLRRVRLCCQKVPFFQVRKVHYVAVPEEISSFRCDGWWRRHDHWSYLASEYAKLVAYSLRYGI